ncbi:MAG: nucleotidyltransferase domain-containing protein [Gemmataceae bacterium]|nr:nucleotidyltransferase domain-containing protein [Gemmataceae bacterium]MCI0743242.1 nucleotidyltransferase domain-containing protein [Gemmataceae bacterium]
MRIIRQFARDVAQQFQPDKIILFGSHAYGRPHADSDVDILVIMPAKNELDQAFRIHSTLLPPFPLDIIVRTPREMQWRLEEGESFTKEIVTRGKTLYEKIDPAVGAQSRVRLPAGRKAKPRRKRAVL